MNILDFLKRLLFGPARPAPGTSPFLPGTGPSRLLVMRHGEKTGDKLDPHLSIEGQQRAQNLVGFIEKNFGTPDFLIAAATSNRSMRPYETLAPLAKALALEIKDKFDDDEADALIEHLRKPKYAAKSGVIAWRHGNIPSLLASFGAPYGSYPQPWDDAVFNLVIEITFTDGAPPRVRQIVEPF
jgi:hypothetical protein